jgi:hypothetical protein
MIYQWIDVNVDLNSVMDIAKRFFETEEFKSRIDELDDGYMVLAIKRVNDEPKAVFVKIRGKRGDFHIEFSAGNHGRSLAVLGPLITLFGLGVILRKEMKRSDFFESLERSFWIYMENAIADFKLSGKNSLK